MNSIAIQHQTNSKARFLRQTLQERTRMVYRNAILAAAESIVLNQGSLAVKMASLAEASGISVGTLYNYFRNKDEVLHALSEHHRARFLAYLQVPSELNDPVAELRQLVARLSAFVEENGVLFNIYVHSSMGPGGTPRGGAASEPEAGAEAHLETLITQLVLRARQAGQIRGDIPPEQLVWSLLAALRALVWQWCQHPGSFSFKQRGADIVTLFLEGVVAQ